MPARKSIKEFIKAQLGNRGYAIVGESVVPSTARLVKQLKHADLMPVTVFDVGVADGTPWLYESFPEAHFHLIDPTRESLVHMRQWAERLDADVHNIALGNEEGVFTLKARSSIIHATLLSDVTRPQIVDAYDVQVRRFDRCFGEFARPALCKIDVEGAELMVLEGMGDRIDRLDVVIVETSLNSLYAEGPEFKDVCAVLQANGLALYDFIGITRRPYDDALHQVDAVFVPARSPLRVKRWS